MERFEEGKDCYINIQGWMVKRLGLKGNELIIYALIHGFCQDGISFFYGSIKYIMESTNLSKETVLSVLQSLVKKQLIIKRDVKSYQVFDSKRTAQGSQHFCLYYTARSRAGKSESAGQETVPANPEPENYGSRNLTGAGQESVPVAGQESVPNNLSDNEFDTATSPALHEKAEAADSFDNRVKEKLTELFGYPVNFSPSPIPKLLQNAKSLSLSTDDTLEYLSWAFAHLKSRCKEKENFDGYFYKSFAEANLMAKFRNISEQRKALEMKRKALMIVCPVCGARHPRTDVFCKSCGLDGDYITNEKEIERARKILMMPPAARKTYEDELRRLEADYPLSKRFCNKTMQRKYEHELNLLERHFGITGEADAG